MTLEEFDATVPGHLRVQPDLVPPEVRRASEYAVDLDALLDGGVPVDQLPAFQEWRASRG